MNSEIIRLEKVNKSFSGNTVLKDINLSVYRGSVLSILGENGAGKTTLMKILSGVYTKDSGEIFFNGEKVQINSPKEAHNLGIRMIYQDSQYIDNFTVAQNFFIGNEIVHKGTRFINSKKTIEETEQFLSSLKCGFLATSKVKELTLAQKKMMEVAKAIYFKAKVVIMDEPTLAFDSEEIKKIFNLIQLLKRMGIAIIYISHRIEEVMKISDRIVVLRDGEVVAIEESPQEFNADLILEEIAGEYRINRYPKTKAKKGRVIFEVKNLSNKSHTIQDVSLKLREGEILGIGGLQGAGKSTLARLITGIEPKSEGVILLDGKELIANEPYKAVKNGVVYLDQYSRNNLFLNKSSAFNVVISNNKKVRNTFFLSAEKTKNAAKALIDRLDIKVEDLHQPIEYLSGGSLKKVAIAKWIFAEGKVFVLDDPSLELDIASKVELYNIMNILTYKGNSIVLISSDLKELIGMSDRILILLDGKVVKEIEASNADAVSLLSSATGKTYK